MTSACDDLRKELDDLLADEIGDGYSRVADAVWAIAEQRARIERQRTSCTICGKRWKSQGRTCTCGEAWSGHPNPHAATCPKHTR